MVFIKGRNMLNNAVAVVSFAMFASFSASRGDYPVAIFFDLLAAFPSVAHDFLFLVLTFLGADSRFLNFVTAMYSGVRAVVPFEGAWRVLFWVFGGVLLGDPLSGSLFVCVMEPFLVAFDKVLGSSKKGVVAACADDLGSVLLRLSHLLPGFLTPWPRWLVLSFSPLSAS